MVQSVSSDISGLSVMESSLESHGGPGGTISLTRLFGREVMEVHDEIGGSSVEVHRLLKEGTLTTERYCRWLGTYYHLYQALESKIQEFSEGEWTGTLCTEDMLAVLAKADVITESLKQFGIENVSTFLEEQKNAGTEAFAHKMSGLHDERDLLPVIYVLFSGHFYGGPALKSYVDHLIEGPWQGEGNNLFYELEVSAMSSMEEVLEKHDQLSKEQRSRSEYQCWVGALKHVFNTRVDSLAASPQDMSYIEGKAKQCFVDICAALKEV